MPIQQNLSYKTTQLSKSILHTTLIAKLKSISALLWTTLWNILLNNPKREAKELLKTSISQANSEAKLRTAIKTTMMNTKE